jgi:hypothetical protein
MLGGKDVLTKASKGIRGPSLFLTLLSSISGRMGIGSTALATFLRVTIPYPICVNGTAKCVLLVNLKVFSGMHIVAETTADSSCVRSKRQGVLSIYSLGEIFGHILSMTHLLAKNFAWVKKVHSRQFYPSVTRSRASESSVQLRQAGEQGRCLT